MLDQGDGWLCLRLFIVARGLRDGKPCDVCDSARTMSEQCANNTQTMCEQYVAIRGPQMVMGMGLPLAAYCSNPSTTLSQLTTFHHC